MLTQTSSDLAHAERYVVRTKIRLSDRVDENEMRRLIEYLGGTPAAEGYSFPSAERRNDALQVLVDKYGACYFVS